MHDHQQQPANTGSDHASWEERYAAAAALWSGRVNPTLAAQAADLPPGRALDVGCGEGGDTLWLASRDWRVTGLDWSQTALDRGAAQASAAGLGDRVTWVQGDVATWEPAAAAFDLVTAHFLHPEAAVRRMLVPRLAAAVAPGGTLLWVGHGYDEERAALWGADRFAAAADVLADLDLQEWDVVLAGSQPRPAGENGHHHTDEVVRVRRRS
ncbi:class I SAM-dependent methyltransferase [Modestobacter sp. VKM Ac-2979]|uniref:class I SAM-dependent methyltransferase n=1 Tax=unclassified Modestobacter TaxID=2643866 RepID=UPI0022AB7B6D|nr:MULTISPECIES: class I SAM-dependent methyltransferase [unclassified Modestobacter]MCZ2810141.1 class I SAM-dependent methyltransferase [Modestobacter sp. VKM Ac-2979]MCZ2841627.1 class I SAM-dependent methyltransferase [Modestobacter sp. VKM Ac-2980]